VEQSRQSQAGGQPVGAKKVLLAETRIFTDCNGISLELGTSQNRKSEVCDFDRTPKGCCESRRKGTAQPSGLEGKGKRPTRDSDQENGKGQTPEEAIAPHGRELSQIKRLKQRDLAS
jgi:hypothetical protein